MEPMGSLGQGRQCFGIAVAAAAVEESTDTEAVAGELRTAAEGPGTTAVVAGHRTADQVAGAADCNLLGAPGRPDSLVGRRLRRTAWRVGCKL